MINEENWDIYSDFLQDDHNQKTESVSELNKSLKEANSVIENLRADLKVKEEKETTLTQQNEELKKNISALLLTAKSELRRKNVIINDLREQLEEYQKRSFFNGGYNGGIHRHYSRTEPVTPRRDHSHGTEEQQTRSTKRKNTEDLEHSAPKRSRTFEPVRERTDAASSNHRDRRSNSNHDSVSENMDLRKKINSRSSESKVIKDEKGVKKSEKSDRNDEKGVKKSEKSDRKDEKGVIKSDRNDERGLKKSGKSDRNDKSDSNTASNKSLDLREKLRNRRASEAKKKEIPTRKDDAKNEDKAKEETKNEVKEEKTKSDTVCENKHKDSESEPKTHTNTKINEEKSVVNTEEPPFKSDSIVKNESVNLNGISSQVKDNANCANDKTHTQSMQMDEHGVNECISEIRKKVDIKADENYAFEKNLDINCVSNRLPSHISKNGEYSIEESRVTFLEKNSNYDNKISNENQEESKVKLRDPRRKGRVEQNSKIVSEKINSTLPTTGNNVTSRDPTTSKNVPSRDPRKRPKHEKTDREKIKTTDENLKEKNSTVDVFSIEDKEVLLQDSSCLKITTEDGDIEQLINNPGNRATDPRKKPQTKPTLELLPVSYVRNVETPDIVSTETESVVSNKDINVQSSVLNKCDKAHAKVTVSSVKEDLSERVSSSTSRLKDEDRIESGADSDGSSLRLVIDTGTAQSFSSSTDTCSQSLWDSRASDNTKSPLNNEVYLKKPDSLAAFEENANHPDPKMPNLLVNKAILNAISTSDIMAALSTINGLDGKVCDKRIEEAADTDICESVETRTDVENLTKIKDTKDSDVHNGNFIGEANGVSASWNKVLTEAEDTSKSQDNSDTPMDLSIHRDSNKTVVQNDMLVQNLNCVSDKEMKGCDSSNKLFEKCVDIEGVTQDISPSNANKLPNELYSNETKLKNDVCSNPTSSPKSEGVKIISKNTSSPSDREVKLSSKPKQIPYGAEKSHSNSKKESSVDKKLPTKPKLKQNLKVSSSTSKIGKLGEKVEVQGDVSKSTKSRSSSRLCKHNSSKQSSSEIGRSVMKNKEGKSHSPKNNKPGSSKSDRPFTKIEAKSKEKQIKNNEEKLEEFSERDENSQDHHKNKGYLKPDKSRGSKTKNVEEVAAGESIGKPQEQEKNCENERQENESTQPEHTSKESITIEKQENTVAVKNSKEIESSLTDVVEDMDVSVEEAGHDSHEKSSSDDIPNETFNEGKTLQSTSETDSHLDSEPRNDDSTTGTANCKGENGRKPESISAENKMGSEKNEESSINQTPITDTPLSGGWLARLFSSGNESEFVKRLQKIEEDIEVLKTATLQRNALLATSSEKTPGKSVIDSDIKSKCSNEKQNSKERPTRRKGRKPKDIPLAMKRLDTDLVTSSSDVLIGNSGNQLIEKTPPTLDSDEPVTRRTRSSERLRARKELTLVPETGRKVKSDDRVSDSTEKQPSGQNEGIGNNSSTTEMINESDTNCKTVSESDKDTFFSEKDAKNKSETQSHPLEVVEKENDLLVESSVSKSTQQSFSKASNFTSDTSIETSDVPSPAVSLSHDLVLSNTSVESLNPSLHSEDSMLSVHSLDSSSSSSSKNQSVQKSFTVNETLIECEPNHSDESESSDDNDTEDETEMKVDSSFSNDAVQMLKSDLDMSSDSNGSENSVVETESHETTSIFCKTPTKKDAVSTTQQSSTPPSPSVKCSINIYHEQKTPVKDPTPLSPPLSPEASTWCRISPVPKFVQSKKVNCDSKLLALINLSAHYLQSSGHSLHFEDRCNETREDPRDPADENGTPVKEKHDKMLIRSSTPRCKPVKESTTIVDEGKKEETSESDDHLDESGSSMINALETSMSNSSKCVNAESVQSEEEIMHMSGSELVSPVKHASLSKSDEKLKSTSTKPFKKPSIEDFKIFQTSNGTTDATVDAEESKEDGEISQDSIDVGEMQIDSNSVNFVFDVKVDEDDELLKDAEAEKSAPKKRAITPKKAFVIPKKTRSSPRLSDKSRSIHIRTDSRTSSSRSHSRHDDRKISWRERSQSPPSKGRRRLYEPHDKTHGYSSSRREDFRSSRPDTSSRDRNRGRDHSRERKWDRSRHRRDRS